MIRSTIKYLLGFLKNNSTEGKTTMKNTQVSPMPQQNIEEKRDHTFKINHAKWKAAVEEILAERNERREQTHKEFWAALDYHYDPILTKLYCIRAQSRGRIHMAFTKLNFSEYSNLPSAKINKVDYQDFINGDGKVRFQLTLDDQAAYVGDAWKEFEDKSWKEGEKGPNCFCGMPTSVIFSDNYPQLLCLFHEYEAGAMFPLPAERPENWPNLTPDELDVTMNSEAEEENKRESN